MRYKKSQSAMEYLMTYGWAILIIAVVLGVMFQLGVFSSASFAPKAKAGSCLVERTTAGASLGGMCQGELPQYVMSLTGYGSAVNQSVVSAIPAQSMTAVTISAWVNLRNLNPCWENVAALYTGSAALDIGVSCSSYEAVMRQDGSHAVGVPSPLISTGTWYFITGEWNGTTDQMTVFLNGGNQQSSTGNGQATYVVNKVNIGGEFNGGVGLMYAFNGTMANVQVYNVTLSAAEVQALYQEGIGGAPVRPQNIVGWWPMNGDVNDYSGNNENGQNNGAGYSSFWTNGYSAP